jgi:hypothetical protein
MSAASKGVSGGIRKEWLAIITTTMVLPGTITIGTIGLIMATDGITIVTIIGGILHTDMDGNHSFLNKNMFQNKKRGASSPFFINTLRHFI